MPNFEGHCLDEVWELRGTRTSQVGSRIGLVDSQAGQVVGTVKIIGQHSESQENLLQTSDKHGVTDLKKLPASLQGRRVWAWELQEPQRLNPLLPYEHKRGQQTWVILSKEQKEERPTKRQKMGGKWDGKKWIQLCLASAMLHHYPKAVTQIADCSSYIAIVTVEFNLRWPHTCRTRTCSSWVKVSVFISICCRIVLGPSPLQQMLGLNNWHKQVTHTHTDWQSVPHCMFFKLAVILSLLQQCLYYIIVTWSAGSSQKVLCETDRAFDIDRCWGQGFNCGKLNEHSIRVSFVWFCSHEGSK